MTSTCPADELGETSTIDRQVSKLVATLMQRDHLSARELDDTISERAFDLFIKSLDPMKTYFLKSDIEEFSQWKDELDDRMKNGDYEICFMVFNRFLERVDQRVEAAIELIDAEHDFTIDEELVTDRDAIDFPVTDEEAHEVWRKRIKYNLLVLKNDEDGEESEEDGEEASDVQDDPKELLRKRYTGFAQRMHQLDNQDVIQMYVSAITNSFDPHTEYMHASRFENFLIDMRLQLEGIGATLQATDDGFTVIKRIVTGGAADKQGELKVDDKIIAVAQAMEDGTLADRKLVDKYGNDFNDVTGMKLDDVVAMIRGSAGTVVRLRVVSDDVTKTIEIVREQIDLEESAAKGRVFEQEGADGEVYSIGIIELPSFYADMGGRDGGARSTTRDVARILGEFNEQGVQAVVLDLRKNGGGSLREAIDCTGLFIDAGPVVQVKDAYGQIQKHNDEDVGMAWDKPLVVLTSRFSASASEILAGAVQDYGRGLVVGDTTTHGKGTVQNLIDLNQLMFKVRRPPNYFGALKITMQQFYRPNGDSTQKRGVLSDIILPSIYDHMDVSESDLDYPVEFDRIPEASHEEYSLVPSDVLSSVRQRSQSRVNESDDFAREMRRIEQYVEQKERTSVSLNEEEFMARRAELSAEQADEDAIEEQMDNDGDIEMTYYLEEVLKITADYMDMIKDKPIASR
ncbi:MAG: carboxy terminal-processing peptidase [Planctomycetota bacterium]